MNFARHSTQIDPSSLSPSRFEMKLLFWLGVVALIAAALRVAYLWNIAQREWEEYERIKPGGN